MADERLICCCGKSAQELYVMDICDALGLKYAGRFSRATQCPKTAHVFPLGSTPPEKEKVVAEVNAAGRMMATLVHPTAQVSRTAQIGAGVLLNPYVTVAQKVKIETGVMIHAHCVIGHDDFIGPYANLAAGCLLSGWVAIGARAALGTGTIVVPGVLVGCGAKVWAGAVVQHNIDANKTFRV